jgi:hypothetical protein
VPKKSKKSATGMPKTLTLKCHVARKSAKKTKKAKKGKSKK